MRSGKAVWLLVFLLFLFPSLSGFSSNTYKIENIIFLPPQFYVGDEVELRILLSVPNDTELVIPSVFPSASWISIKKIEIARVKENPEIRLVFSSFQPGTRTLPSLDLGGILLEGVRIHTKSVLQEESYPFFEALGPIALPGTVLYLSLGIVLLAFGPVLVIIFGGRLLVKIKESLKTKRRGWPYRKFLRGMTELEAKIENIDNNDFYTALAGELRKYITRRTGKNLLSTTTKEARHLLETLFGNPVWIRSLVPILEYGDQVRFGNAQAEYPKRKSDFSSYKASVANMEESIKRKEMETHRSRGRKQRREGT